jgi:hypothetical protein
VAVDQIPAGALRPVPSPGIGAIRERPTRVGWNAPGGRRGGSGPDDRELVAVQLEEIVRRVD